MSVATDRGALDTLCVNTAGSDGTALAWRFAPRETETPTASGSEVHVARDAARAVESDGVRVRLVSMPCLDRFAAQDLAYRDAGDVVATEGLGRLGAGERARRGRPCPAGTPSTDMTDHRRPA